MDFSRIKRFKASEFPSIEEVNLTDPELFYTLDSYAQDLGDKIPVYPSSAKGALARITGSKTSRHYAVGRLSTAVDFFVGCPPLKAFLMAQVYFRGIGVYFDVHFRHKPWIMLHGDLRQSFTVWRRDNFKYYTIKSLKDYVKLINDLRRVNWSNK